MSRLLALSGEFVATRKGYFHITAYDPATGRYIGMGHAPSGSEKLEGETPLSCLGVHNPGAENGVIPVTEEKHPVLGPITRQTAYGVCGVMRGRLRGAVCEIGAPHLGDALVVTNVREFESLFWDGLLSGWRENTTFGETILENAQITGVSPWRTTAISIQITNLRDKSGVGFAFDGLLMAGFSGAPIIQDGKLVGAVYGSSGGADNHGIGRNIEAMVNNLLGRVERFMPGGSSSNSGHHGRDWDGSGGKGNGKRIPRTTTARMWQAKVYRGQFADFMGRAQASFAMYQSLEREAPRIASLEAQVRRYEAGNISEGILYQGHQVTYVEALRRIWAYRQARLRLAAHSWVYAGAITKRQYRDIIGCQLHEV